MDRTGVGRGTNAEGRPRLGDGLARPWSGVSLWVGTGFRPAGASWLGKHRKPSRGAAGKSTGKSDEVAGGGAAGSVRRPRGPGPAPPASPTLRRRPFRAMSGGSRTPVIRRKRAAVGWRGLAACAAGLGSALLSAADPAPFANGADPSWYTQMVHDAGYVFRSQAGLPAPCLSVLQSVGINAIRLRVWLNPAGGWCNRADVVAKALAANALGQRVMLDFHFSDTWAS